MAERSNPSSAGRSVSHSPRRSTSNRPYRGRPDTLEGGLGAGDSSSGGGAGAGIPGGGTDMRTNPKPIRDEDVERDRQKLFPEATSRRRQGE